MSNIQVERSSAVLRLPRYYKNERGGQSHNVSRDPCQAAKQVQEICNQCRVARLKVFGLGAECIVLDRERIFKFLQHAKSLRKQALPVSMENLCNHVRDVLCNSWGDKLGQIYVAHQGDVKQVLETFTQCGLVCIPSSGSCCGLVNWH
jgi:hypothetical protein